MSAKKHNLDSLFEVAMGIESAEERAVYIEQQCGDDLELRKQLEQLLVSDQQAGSFLEKPPSEFGATIIHQSEDDLAASMEAGLAPAFGEDAAVVVGDAGHSVLKSLGHTIDVPRVALRESHAEGPDPITRPQSPEMPSGKSDSRYRLDGEIARGGMGAIIKGRDTDLGRDLAIKVLLDQHKDKPEVIQRFVEEAQIGGQLQHPGIAPIYELGQFSDKRPFFSMKLVKGQSLSKLLADREDAAEDRGRFLGIFEQVCQTMAYAHSRGVIHRDLKPANVMVGAFGEVQVMDWGLAKVLPAGGVADEKKAHDKQQGQSVIQTLRSQPGSDPPGTFGTLGSQTQMGSVMGTPAYMPPEQALGEIDNLDERADVFGLGAILCEILTGKPPYVADDGTRVFRLASRGKLDDCFQRLEACGADEELIALTKQCLAPEPVDRPRDASVLAERVTAYLESVETKLRETEMERAAEAARVVELHRRRNLHYAIAAMLLIGLVTAGFAANHFRSLEQTQRNLAANNERLANERETERNAALAAKARETRLKEEAIAAEARETKLKDEAIGLKDQALQARNRADAAATLAENRSEEIRKSLYASEMQIALNAENQGGGALRMQALLDRWRPAEGESDLRGWEWYYLRSRIEQAELVLDHPASVLAADWSRDGSRVYTGCQDGAIRIWDADSGRMLQSLKGAAAVRGLQVDPEGDRLASVDAVGNLIIRKVGTGEVVLQKRFPSIRSLKWSRDGARIAVLGAVTMVVEAASGDVLASLESRNGSSVDWNPDGERLAIASGLDLVVWNIKTDEKTLFENQFDYSNISTAEWGLGSDGVVVGGKSGFYLADPQTGKVTQQNSLRDDERPWRLAFSTSHTRLAYSGFDYEVRLVDPRSWELIRGLRGHTQEVEEVRWSPDEARLLTAGLDGTVRIWRIDHLDDDYRDVRGTRSVAWRPGGSELVVGDNHDVHSWRYPFYSYTPLPSGPGLTFADWSPDGGRVARGANDDWVISDWNSRQVVLQSHPDRDSAPTKPADFYICLVAWEPGGERLLVGSSKELRLHSTKDGRLLREWKIERRPWIGTFPEFAKWHPQGRLLAIADGNRIQVVDVETGQVQQEWQTDHPVGALAWHPAGELLATGRTSDFLVELWEAAAAQKLAEIGGGSQPVTSLEWSPDGSLLAIGGRDKTVRLWNRESARTVLTLFEDDPVSYMDWDDSGTRLAVSTTGGLKVYDAARGYLVEGSSRALTSVDQWILADPERLLFRVQRAQLLERLDRWQEAAAAWNTLRELRPDDPWYAEQGLAASLQELEPQAAIAQLEVRLAENPDDTVAAKLLGRRLLAEAGPDDWELLDVQEAVSEKGAFLLPQPDGSLLAAGDNPDGDVYRVTGRTKLNEITAIRLETIPDERLPGGGSGRAKDGNFQLGNFSVQFGRDGNPQGMSLPLSVSQAWTDYENPRFPLDLAIDTQTENGWEPFPLHRERHVAVFELDQHSDLSGKEVLTIHLQTATRGGNYSKHNLGRFRLAVTDRPHAARLAELAHTIAQDPDAYDPWTLLGIIRSIREEPDAAAEAFGRALDEAADDEPRRMRILAEAARDEAVFRRIVEERAVDPAVIARHANSLAKAGETDAAIALLSGALTLHPDSFAWRWERGKTLAAAGRWKQAAEDLSTGLAPDHPAADDFAFRADVFEKAGQRDHAITDWKRALERKPGDGNFTLRLVDALLGSGNWAEAAETAQRRFESAPQDAGTWLRLAPALVLSGDEAGYAAFREKLAGIVGDSSSLRSCDLLIKSCLLLPPPPGFIDRLPVGILRETAGENHDGAAAKWIWSFAAASAAAPAGERRTFRRQFGLNAAPLDGWAAISCDNEYRLLVNGREVAADRDWTTVDAVSLTPYLKQGANELLVVAANHGGGPNPAGLLIGVRVRLAPADATEQPAWRSWSSGPEWQWTDATPDSRGNLPADADWRPAVPVDNEAVWGATAALNFYGCLALTDLRSGEFAEAEARTVTALEKGRSSYSDSLNLAVRSMAQARQGKLDEARRSLEEVTRILAGVGNPRHHDHLIADILRREAETLLKELEEK